MALQVALAVQAADMRLDSTQIELAAALWEQYRLAVMRAAAKRPLTHTGHTEQTWQAQAQLPGVCTLWVAWGRHRGLPWFCTPR